MTTNLIQQDAMVAKIEEMIPKSLDDIIRKNRHLAQMRMATPEDILKLEASVEITGTPMLLNQWRLIALCEPGRVQVFLIGTTKAGKFRMTSRVMATNFDAMVFRTQSGTLYGLGEPGAGEPDQDDLMGICAVMTSWGMGAALGMPAFFY